MSSQLPNGFVARIRIVKSTLDDVYPISLDEWINNFDVNRNPEIELFVWECMALTYHAFTENRKISSESKEEVIQVILLCSGGATEKCLYSKCNILAERDIQYLYKLYRASSETIFAVYQERKTMATSSFRNP